jgi:cob(I)alamin adenosyltransferase
MKSSIYTKTGDKGETSLADGSRVPKTAARVEAYGAVDEASSWIGAARAFGDDPLLDQVLEFLQHRFYNCSSNIATPPAVGSPAATVSDEDVAFLEQAIDRFEERAGAITGFVLPGGSRAASLLHVARTVCRRAERALWMLAAGEPVDRLVLKLVNRSSDLLFAAARYANAVDAGGDVMWDKDLPLPNM